MKFENQVVNLDIAKRLKELGVKQESLWYWYKWRNESWMIGDDQKWLGTDWEHVSAFTVAELGELLPQGCYDYIQKRAAQKYGKWIAKYWAIKEMYQLLADTEADCRGKMLIYLLEINLI